jgi:hypothetical protein
MQQATWSSPVTSRILLEAGWGTYQARYRNPEPRQDGSHNDRMIRTQEQTANLAADIPALLTYRMPAGVGGGFNHHLIGTLANNRASISYVTGAHNMKFGYQGGFSNPSQTYTYFNPIIAVRLNNGVPNRLRRALSTQRLPTRSMSATSADSVLRAGSFTTGWLTLQGASGRPPAHDVSRIIDRRPGYTAPPRKSCIPRGRRKGFTGMTSPLVGVWRTTCSATARRPSS